MVTLPTLAGRDLTSGPFRQCQSQRNPKIATFERLTNRTAHSNLSQAGGTSDSFKPKAETVRLLNKRAIDRPWDRSGQLHSPHKEGDRDRVANAEASEATCYTDEPDGRMSLTQSHKVDHSPTRGNCFQLRLTIRGSCFLFGCKFAGSKADRRVRSGIFESRS